MSKLAEVADEESECHLHTLRHPVGDWVGDLDEAAADVRMSRIDGLTEHMGRSEMIAHAFTLQPARAIAPGARHVPQSSDGPGWFPGPTALDVSPRRHCRPSAVPASLVERPRRTAEALVDPAHARSKSGF
jgi:hypothetical protein